MKKYILMALLGLSLFTTQAHAQWVVSDPMNFAGNIANTVKEIATASKTVKNTLNGFKEVEKLYNDTKKYYDALKKVNNLIGDAYKVKETILMVGDISEIYVSSYKKMLSDTNFRPTELAAMASGYSKLLELSGESLKELKSVAKSNVFSMNDSERMQMIDRIYNTVRDFETETNMSVICEDGSFYSYNVKYAEEPEKLNVEMKDFLSPTGGRLPSNRADIYFKELGNESPILVKLMMESIYKSNKRTIKHIGIRQFGMRFLLRGLYAHNGLLYFHTRIDNDTNMPYSVDFITFKVVDKKVAKRTAIQEHVLQPLRAYHQIMWVKGQSSDRSIFALEQFALSEDKQLEVTLYERNGGRTLSFYVQNEDLLLARRIDNLKLKW